MKFVDINGKEITSGTILKYDEKARRFDYDPRSIDVVIMYNSELYTVTYIRCDHGKPEVLCTDKPIRLLACTGQMYNYDHGLLSDDAEVQCYDCEAIGNVDEDGNLLGYEGALHCFWSDIKN